MKKYFVLFAFLAYCCTAFAVENVDFNIRFYDKRIYYPQKDPIYIQLTLTNKSPDVFRFKLCEDRAFSIDFDTRTLSNKPIEAADFLIRKRSTKGQIFFREVSLESGESFSWVENLRDYNNIHESGAFIVQAKFFPELLNQSAARQEKIEKTNFQAATGLQQQPAILGPITSNRLSLQIRPPAIAAEGGIPVALEEETMAILAREKMAPDEVVAWTLRARQHSHWERFFLYLDLEAMVARDAGKERKWRSESEEGRKRMVERWRGELQSSVIDGDISAIPIEFKIERTNYADDEGTVSVLEKFKAGDYTERKRYTYYLKRTDDIWTIYDYVVMNLGTE
ncbi:hypothetical protein FACS1894190_18070 [Spirochaetia bacterium]|nr:hypothetical protein FACS1894190_18070 [Spirochaetia bacterium]